MRQDGNGLLRALASGFTGALAVTLINETARRIIPHAPRLDALGRRALSGTLKASGVEPPKGKDLQRASLLGDLLSNTIYYSLIGVGEATHPWLRGTLLGVGAGIGAALLPPVIGLGKQPEQKTPATELLTVGWYLAGGLAAAAVARRFRN